MVEEDPNEEAYYEMGKRSTSSIPVSIILYVCDYNVRTFKVIRYQFHTST